MLTLVRVKSLPGSEIAKLRKSGVEVSEEYFHPLFVFMGDTHINALKQNPQLFNYPTIVVECTFIGDEAEVRERADRDGHIHWYVFLSIFRSFLQMLGMT